MLKTENDWWDCTHPRVMLHFLLDSRAGAANAPLTEFQGHISAENWQLAWKVSPRKLRLIASAYCRHHPWHCFTTAYAQQALDAAEQYADGLIGGVELVLAADAASGRVRQSAPAVLTNYSHEHWLPYYAVLPDVVLGLDRATSEVADHYGAFQADTIREIVGYPFQKHSTYLRHGKWQKRVSSLPAWLPEDNGACLFMAQDIYNRRLLSDLPILADSLEDAGCPYTGILKHLRTEQTHALGCWALDDILCKE